MEQIAALFLETGKAHHAAFIETDGDDPEWPLWYAEYLHKRLPPIVGTTLTISDLTYLMIELDRRQKRLAPDNPWFEFYAAELLKHLQQLGTNDHDDFLPDGETIPSLSEEQMVEVDRAMIEDYGISLVQMMENAGRNLAHLAQRRFLAGDPRRKKIAVLAGTGGNGGGALVGGRHLANHGAEVFVFTTRDEEGYTGAPFTQLSVLRRMGIHPHPARSLKSQPGDFDLILDGIIGYSLRGAPSGIAADMIRWANDQAVPILALDVPSGIDVTSGAVSEPSIRATATMTLALPKAGLLTENARGNVGELYLADIGVPPALYAGAKLGFDLKPIFASSEILRLI